MAGHDGATAVKRASLILYMLFTLHHPFELNLTRAPADLFSDIVHT